MILQQCRGFEQKTAQQQGNWVRQLGTDLRLPLIESSSNGFWIEAPERQNKRLRKAMGGDEL